MCASCVGKLGCKGALCMSVGVWVDCAGGGGTQGVCHSLHHMQACTCATRCQYAYFTCRNDVEQGFKKTLGFRREPRVWALGYRP
jgi:hypothetical protein